MKHARLTATTLRLILAISLVLAIAAAAIIFTLASTQLKDVATTVSHKVADAEASQNSLTNLKKIEAFLAEHQEAVTRANDIVAESKSYQYQDQIIFDLKTYASTAGVKITNFDFTSGNSAAPTTPAAGAGAAAAAPTEGAQPAAAAAPTVKSTSVSISLESPVRYENLLRFVKAIEQNLTKMQISAITLSKGTTNDQVTTDTIDIEVYIR